MAQSYLVIGDIEKGVERAIEFARDSLKVEDLSDLVVLKYGLFSVEDARRLSDIAHASPIGGHKAVIASATRFFHEAQNALLKLFEEPPPDVTLVLAVPSEGMLLSTLRSRLAPLPNEKGKPTRISESASAFLKADGGEREKMIGKLVDRSKSDKDEEKQRARSDAVRLAEDLLRAADSARRTGKNEDELLSFIDDLMHFIPLLHTRSAPLKLIFEHISLVIPKGLQKAGV